jgi:exopolysaccharide biosynthesis polyprenyl glycosylphosphotransferase
MIVHETIVEPMPGGPYEAAVPAVPAPLVRSARQIPHWLAAGAHSALVFVAVYVFLLSDGRAAGKAVGVAVVLAGIWVATLALTRSAVRQHVLAVGGGGAVVIGTVAGLIAASAAGLWVPDLRLHPVSLLGVALSVLVMTAAWRAFLDSRDITPRRLLIVGGGRGALELIETLEHEKVPFEAVAVVDDDHPDDTVAGIPTKGRIKDLPQVVLNEHPDLVVLAIDRKRPQVFKELLDVAGTGFQVVGLPEFYEHAFGRVPVRHVSAAWFMSVLHLYQRPYTRFAKRTFDVVVASIALFLVAPVLLALSLLVRRTGHSVIFRQTRLGEGGKHFTMYKFRTMHEGAEEPGTPLWAEERDPRVTPIGRLMRRTRLDELPQLWNVLRGDMSIVGPRPERPEFLMLLERSVPYWSRRHLLKPGITGWAQVRNGYAADCAGTEEKLSYDLWYLRHRSLLVDLIICVKTFPKLLSGWGAR